MREIKFRAWCPVLNRFFYLDFKKSQMIKLLNEAGIICATKENFHITTSDLRTLKWDQYTGLKDKNGKEIYEGDILELNDGDGWVVGKDVVKYESGAFNIAVYSDDRKQYESYEELIEIIGNIYENPELLEDKND